jgi:hypothetical protein
MAIITVSSIIMTPTAASSIIVTGVVVSSIVVVVMPRRNLRLGFLIQRHSSNHWNTPTSGDYSSSTQSLTTFPEFLLRQLIYPSLGYATALRQVT